MRALSNTKNDTQDHKGLQTENAQERPRKNVNRIMKSGSP